MSLVVDNKDLGGNITYNSESFYTKKPDSPTTAFKYNLDPDFDKSMMSLSYDIFISDPQKLIPHHPSGEPSDRFQIHTPVFLLKKNVPPDPVCKDPVPYGFW